MKARFMERSAQSNAGESLDPLPNAGNELTPLADPSSPPMLDMPGDAIQQIAEPFIDALSRDCPLCGGARVTPQAYFFDEKDKAVTITFDDFGTAIVNSAALAIAGIVGKPEIAENPGVAIVEICRLFLRTTPAVTGCKTVTLTGASLAEAVESQAATLAGTVPAGDDIEELYDGGEPKQYNE